MNYEELLHAKENSTGRAARMPFGNLLKKQIDGKYHYVLEFRHEIAEKPGFKEALKNDERTALSLKSKQQLRYVISERDGVTELELDQGQYQTLEQLLSDNPAIVAKTGFVDNLVNGLLDIADELHQHSVFQLSFSPRNVLIRKGDEMPMLLLHASAFVRSVESTLLFDGQEDFVAPEALSGEKVTAASDIFSIAKLVEWLHQQGDMSFEYKRMVKKATQPEPGKRYDSVTELRSALKSMRNTKHSAIMFVSALIVALLCVWLYFELVPKGESIEFIEGAPAEEEESLLDEGGFDPESDIDIWADVDTTDTATVEEREAMETYMKKAEDIFRKRFALEADRILSKVYNDASMNANEKVFIANTNVMRDQLLKVQTELAEQTGISDLKAGRIAMEVIDQLTEEKKNSLTNNVNQ